MKIRLLTLIPLLAKAGLAMSRHPHLPSRRAAARSRPSVVPRAPGGAGKEHANAASQGDTGLLDLANLELEEAVKSAGTVDSAAEKAPS